MYKKLFSSNHVADNEWLDQNHKWQIFNEVWSESLRYRHRRTVGPITIDPSLKQVVHVVDFTIWTVSMHAVSTREQLLADRAQAAVNCSLNSDIYIYFMHRIIPLETFVKCDRYVTFRRWIPSIQTVHFIYLVYKSFIFAVLIVPFYVRNCRVLKEKFSLNWITEFNKRTCFRIWMERVFFYSGAGVDYIKQVRLTEQYIIFSINGF